MTGNEQKFSLQGKVAIVTGAGSGIGRETALCLANAGANVVVAEANETTGKETAAEISAQTGSRGLFILTDVSRSESVQAMVIATIEAFGRLDIAVNNAALHPDASPIADLHEDHWQKIIGVNLVGVAFCLKWELQQMIQQGGGGSIINISSATINRPQEKMSAYIAAKHGITGLTQTAAVENGRHGIRVNALAPGGVATDLTMATMQELGLTEENEAARSSLFKRFAKPEEIAQSVLWLASDAASYVTGATVAVDSGLSLI
ncbi:hypothetical protein BDV30DRAFT_245585 [Aspergillus minisclerotigenes]|uniref:Glucose 1-dehydrogenase n=1 Tax=Aspergillus minisclerotigenes TaxID=656917 RepID=A0A5N6IR54_9EURO|nr:hypothetical protein BDV30DRAFT_245585 [Aspergillus minisclerotigenes]